MIDIIMAVAQMGPLGERPVSLTGPNGAAKYEAELKYTLRIDGVVVRLDAFFGDCKDIQLSFDGYELTDFVPEILDKTKKSPSFPERFNFDAPRVAPKGDSAIEHIKASGCGKDYRINIRTGEGSKSKLFIGNAFNVGYSLADPVIQSYVAGGVESLVLKDLRATPHAPCEMMPLIYDVRVSEPPKPDHSVWKETWYSYYCDYRQTTEVTFTPNEDGTSLLVEGKLLTSD